MNTQTSEVPNITTQILPCDSSFSDLTYSYLLPEILAKEASLPSGHIRRNEHLDYHFWDHQSPDFYSSRYQYSVYVLAKVE